MNRRSLLNAALGGGAAIVVAGTAAGGWRAARAGLLVHDEAPFAPWKTLATARPGDPVGLAAAAILASNPHNTQPWRLTVSADRFIIEADTARHLGAFDPFRREMWIGLGAAVANAEVVAPGLGFRTGEPFLQALGPEGAGRIVMTLSRSDAVPDPLLAAIHTRRTNRAPYDPSTVPVASLERVRALTGSIPGARLETVDRETAAGQLFAERTVEGTKAINADEEMVRDGHVWFRATAREVAEHRDGVSIPTAGLSPLMSILGQLMPEPDSETSGGYWLRSTIGQVAGAAGFGFILVDDLDDRAGQMAAGRLWERHHLALTGEGLVAQPLNQLPELVDRDRQLGRNTGWQARLSAIAPGAGQVTFAFRYGVPTREVPRSARRPLEWVSS